MPIYEFKCSQCQDIFELLVRSDETETEMKCPKCGSPDFERVLSTTHHVMGNGQGRGAKVENRQCAAGSCTTYDIPGPS